MCEYVAERFDDDATRTLTSGARPALASIGPRYWSPVANPGFRLRSAADGAAQGASGEHPFLALRPDGVRQSGGASRSEKQGRGRATLVVFYLGFGCLHCVEQLHMLRPLHGEFAELGVDIVAIGSDTAGNIRRANLDLPVAERMPFPMLADPKLEAFRAWRCHDDFEDMALHGTFLVDGAGRIRWQDISYEPFTEVEWLLTETRRLLSLPVPEAVR